MLILQRHVDEQVVINPGGPDEVVITVVMIDRNRVRLGFAAADDVVIHREEVVRAIERERARKARA